MYARNLRYLLVTLLSMVPITAWAVDSDGDGVDDTVDVCCDTPPGTAVDPTGRPIGDFDLDCDNDLADYAIYMSGFTGPLPPCNPPDGTPCDDGNDCTHSDMWSNGVCIGTSYVCDDGLTCTDDLCDGAGGCIHPVMPGTCLIGGVCYSHGDPHPSVDCLECGPSSMLTWSPVADGAPCDDGDACTVSDTCVGGTCTVTPLVCDDGNDCTNDTCVFGMCIYDGSGMDGAGCDDGNACTQVDTCFGGSCLGTPVICDDGEACTVDSCNATTGLCVFDPTPLNGAACTDGDVCTVGDVCAGGVCVGSAISCDDGNSCTADSCDGSGCNYDPIPLNGSGCDDGDNCTIGDVCVNGLCGGSPLDCSNLDDQCKIGVCNPTTGTCSESPLPVGMGCDDGDINTVGDQCDGAGNCVGTIP